MKEYLKLELTKVLDYERFNNYAIVHHSSAMEGSTLTLEETNVLLDNGLTPKGKPLEHTLMVKDHYKALLYAIVLEKKKELLKVEHLHELNALVMKNTGAVRSNVLGTVDETKGEFRNANVRAGATTFINYDKIIGRVGELIKAVNDNINIKDTEQQLKLSFYVHFN